VLSAAAAWVGVGLRQSHQAAIERRVEHVLAKIEDDEARKRAAELRDIGAAGWAGTWVMAAAGVGAAAGFATGWAARSGLAKLAARRASRQHR
jgi:hypothetical protein